MRTSLFRAREVDGKNADLVTQMKDRLEALDIKLTNILQLFGESALADTPRALITSERDKVRALLAEIDTRSTTVPVGVQMAREQEKQAIAAEQAAREHRLNLDRVIAAALACLSAKALNECVSQHPDGSPDDSVWLNGYTGVSGDVKSLIDEIKRSLSPLVRLDKGQ